MDRRTFLKTSTAAAGAVVSGGIAPGASRESVAFSDVQSASTSVSQYGTDLFRDDFSSFPSGWLSRPVGQLNGAIQEYHYLANRGVPLGPWANAICHLDVWIVGDEDGKSYLEQHTVNDLALQMNPVFVTGDPEWTDYTVEVKLKPLSVAEMAGVVFRYHTNRHYYLFALTSGSHARLALRLPVEHQLRVGEWKELGRADFPYDCKKYFQVKIENSGSRIRAFVDDRLIVEASDEELKAGKAGVTANIPARFQDFRVYAGPEVRTTIARHIDTREAELRRLRDENPRPKLWKQFSTPKFGAGRSARFGDLDGDGQIEMLIAQNIPRVSGDAHDQISCLTAVSLDGKILWQSGRPNPRNILLTNDLPFQIHDIDGDGQNEVIAVRDFKLQILEGRSGRVKLWTWMPTQPPAASGARPPYAMENGDSLALVNVSGGKERRDILVKDRYTSFWIFNQNLDLLWAGRGQTGHFPYPFDIDGDGKDEILIGYTLWDHTGERLWSHDEELHDHADAVFVGNLSEDASAEPRAYVSGSDEGLLIFDKRGTILNHVRVGHAQSGTIGRFRSDLSGLQYMTVNFWKNPGIVTLFDKDGNILMQEEPIHSASSMLPVNWRGDGQDFVLLSGNVHEGGMIDGHMRRVVMFPDDGHPDLCASVANLTGDARDEVILWDQNSVWIYTQDRPATQKQIYAPIRNPPY
ncbi:MAG TPA: twin-arginine translocation signal domain-containing protein, partial [Terriglobales bacterium]|nr:twin-arginine translocation signal domain-containing protein [Terriglobales bacterium]